MTKPRFMRLVDGHIETAVKTFLRDDTSVIFVGNIHSGSKEYFRSILAHLRDCDRVLYEKRGKDADRMPDDLRPYEALFSIWSALSFHPAAGSSMAIKEIVDLQQPGWVWCDVWFSEIYEELRRLLPHERDREEYVLAMYRRYLQQRFYVPADNARFFRLLATFFQEDLIGQVLIRLSNVRLASGLKEALAEGLKMIGILYGASHGDEIEQLLLEELGFSLHDESWTTVVD